MKLAEKYNIPSATIKNMVQDGVISCSWPLREEIFEMFTQLKNSGQSHEVIYEIIAKAKGCTDHTVRKYVYEMRKF